MIREELTIWSGCWLALGWLGLAASITVAQSVEDASSSPLPRFLESHCLGCHGESKQNAERRFDALPGTIEGDNTLVDFQDILDALNRGAMPPEDEPQPTDAARRETIEWLTKTIANFHSQRDAKRGQPTLRRLNAREYRNTLRDLLKINVTMYDPAQFFPQDQTSENLDNIGSALVTSGFLLERYLESADVAIEKVLSVCQQPAKQTWHFADGFHQQPEIDQVHRKTNGYAHLTLYDVIGADKHEGAYAPIHAFAQGVEHDGYYEIKFLAEALNRDNPYEDEFLGTDRSQPLRLGIVAGNQLAGPLHKPQPVEPMLAEIELVDEKKWYTVRVWLDKGFTPRFTFTNGLMDARDLWGKLIKRYPDQFPNPNAAGIVARRFDAIKYGKLPQIHIHEVEISGPFFDSWPTAAHRALLGVQCEDVLQTGTFPSTQSLRDCVARFASAAYRRPASDDEVAGILAVIEKRRAAGRNELQAFGDGLKVVLCSPNFLFLPEASASEEYVRASKMAYFLWSSQPDKPLLDLASSGQLASEDVRRQQAERMLADKRSDAFVQSFLDAWLGLRELGATPPERTRFPNYYHYDLGNAMRQETLLFTKHLLDENLSVDRFLDADFTFVNRPLAKHYGIEPPQGSSFSKVELKDMRRGGLLGQASILTLTANGIDTSPVVRGVWLLENLLGTPPAPPPPDVEPLDPDTRGATTIRDQLEKHRQVASCNDCHRKIDPLGFALENFDPIGAWRDRYPGKQPIDASGALSGDREFHDVVQFKKFLMEDKRVFYQGLVRKLLAYASGKQIGPLQRPEIDRIAERLNAKDFGLRDLVIEIAISVTK